MTEIPQTFDRALLRAHRKRAAALGPATFLLDRVAEDLADRLSLVLRRFPLAADLGTPSPALRRALAAAPSIGRLVAVDSIPAHLAGESLAVAADEEALPFREGSLDLIVSALALQTVNDLPGTLIQARRALKPDGLLLAALLGGETLSELRRAFARAETETTGGLSPRVAPFVDLAGMGALLQRAGFALPVCDVDRVTVRYETPLLLLDDLRRMGAGNVLHERRRVPLGRGTLARMIENYVREFSDPDGRVRATFDVVWVSGWAPHESQQKPARPGSAVVRLADALAGRRLPGKGTEE